MDKPIRVLQVLGRMNRGGAETMIMTLYRNIDRSKVQFDFLVHTNETCDYDAEIEALGGNIYRVPRYTVKNHLAYKQSFNQFFEKHKEFKMVHCHINSTAAIVAKIAKKHDRTIIVHSHNTSYESGFSNRIKELLQLPLKNEKNTDFRFACGKEAGEWLFGKSEFKVINNAIDSEKFVFNGEIRNKIREQYGIQDKFVIGNVARFNEQKNHTFLVDIFYEVHKENQNAVLMLVGDGELREEIEDKVEKLGLKSSVIFAGVQANVNEILMGMDVFLFPSLFEGLPVTLIEAQATGLQLMISDTISKEVDLTGLVNYISLENTASNWSEKCLNVNDNFKRMSVQDTIIKAGYDISTNAIAFKEFYLMEWNKKWKN